MIPIDRRMFVVGGLCIAAAGCAIAWTPTLIKAQKTLLKARKWVFEVLKSQGLSDLEIANHELYGQLSGAINDIGSFFSTAFPGSLDQLSGSDEFDRAESALEAAFDFLNDAGVPEVVNAPVEASWTETWWFISSP